MFLPLGLAGLATKTKAAAFVIFADWTYLETALNDTSAVREAQAEAVKFQPHGWHTRLACSAAGGRGSHTP